MAVTVHSGGHLMKRLVLFSCAVLAITQAAEMERA
jgi:hypothetical protein